MRWRSRSSGCGRIQRLLRPPPIHDWSPGASGSSGRSRERRRPVAGSRHRFGRVSTPAARAPATPPAPCASSRRARPSFAAGRPRPANGPLRSTSSWPDSRPSNRPRAGGWSDAGAQPAEGDDREALAERLVRLERRRETLGAVNPLAKQEYEEEKERLTELTTQREDLERSLAELEKLRNELSETVERRFDETFAAVQQHFADVAQTLFPGGEGRLRLSEPDEDGPDDGSEPGSRSSSGPWASG